MDCDSIKEGLKTDNYFSKMFSPTISWIEFLILDHFKGGNALFEGKVKGNPRPQVVWTRKGLQMKGIV